METNKVIKRVQYPTIPVKVTYELTPHIKKYVHVIDQYRQLMVIHLYIYKDNYSLSDEVVEDLELYLNELKLNVHSLLDSK